MPRRSSSRSSSKFSPSSHLTSTSSSPSSSPSSIFRSKHLALTISILSLISSAFYTHTYVSISQTSFFNTIHTEYATEQMMNAFDALESFRDVVGVDKYPSEFVRLKTLSRKQFSRKFDTQNKDLKVAFNPEAELGVLLDKSRRHILHYFGKIVMFEEQGLLRRSNVLEFPGKGRSIHAISLLEPLVLETEKHCQKISHKKACSGYSEHYEIFDGLRKLYTL